MIGAIAGDIIGSVYENFRTKRKDFTLFTRFSTFTDDSVLTIAVADAILTDRDYGRAIKSYARFGNGSAMRVSPVAHAFESEEEVLEEARRTAECTHNHPEGIKGAQATALAIFRARIGQDKEAIRKAVQDRYGYDLSRTIDAIRPGYRPDITCQGSVPEAIIAFLDSTSFEDAVRNAVSLGGDADTQACIAGAIAEAYYRMIPAAILEQVRKRLAKPLWQKTLEFYARYGIWGIAEQLELLDAK
jgi:ADP-ribosylglycohydrolase